MKKTADVPMGDCVSPSAIHKQFSEKIKTIVNAIRIAGMDAESLGNNGILKSIESSSVDQNIKDDVYENINAIANAIVQRLKQQLEAGILKNLTTEDHRRCLDLTKEIQQCNSSEKKYSLWCIGSFFTGIGLAYGKGSIPIELLQSIHASLFLIAGLAIFFRCHYVSEGLVGNIERLEGELHEYIRANIDTAVMQAIEAESDAESEEPTSPSAATQTSD